MSGHEQMRPSSAFGLARRWRDWADVLAFVALLLALIWIVTPLTGGSRPWGHLLAFGAIGLCFLSLGRRGLSGPRSGLRLDNMASATAVYLLATMAYTGAVLLAFHDSLRPPDAPDLGGATRLLSWAAVQQFCLLTFLLRRLRRLVGHDLIAVLATAGIFALFHLPNPFLTLFTLGGGSILGLLFLRWPSLPAAVLAHAAASWIVSDALPSAITAGMRVGPHWMH